jgi:hypothetical protein
MKKILWISDYTSLDHIGGAELTTDAYIETLKHVAVVEQVKTHALNRSMIDADYDLVIMDSMTNIRSLIIYDIIKKFKFVSIEYDYNKVSMNRHVMDTNEINQYLNGDSEWAMFYKTFWQHPNRVATLFMSEGQMNIHIEKFNDAGLEVDKNSLIVIGSNFTDNAYNLIDKLNKKRAESESWIENDYLVFDSSNPLKGRKETVAYCEEHKINYHLFSNLSPNQLLRLMSKSKGIVYMPTMHDTCPRLLIEAKMLGLDVVTNNYVQNANEAWFRDGDSYSIKNYLLKNKQLFALLINQYIAYNSLT